MTTGAVAAVDLGATSGRVIIGHVGPDTLETETVTRFPNTPVQLIDGLHWDILGLYGAALGGLRDAFRAEPEITSIGVDAWAVDYGLLRGERLLGDPFHYRDARTERGVAAVHERMPHADLYARNGLQFLPFNTLYQLAAEDPELLAFADTALLVPDLIGYWLTGAARAEQTNASTTGLLRVADGSWDDELVAALGLPRGILPSLIAPGERLGAPAAGGRRGHRRRRPLQPSRRSDRTTPPRPWSLFRCERMPPPTSPAAPGDWSEWRCRARC